MEEEETLESLHNVNIILARRLDNQEIENREKKNRETDGEEKRRGGIGQMLTHCGALTPLESHYYTCGICSIPSYVMTLYLVLLYAWRACMLYLGTTSTQILFSRTELEVEKQNFHSV